MFLGETQETHSPLRFSPRVICEVLQMEQLKLYSSNKSMALFSLELQKYTRFSHDFFDRDLLKLLEKFLGLRNTAITCYQNKQFKASITYVNDVAPQEIKAIRERYRKDFVSRDYLSQSISQLSPSLEPEESTHLALRARSLLSSRELNEYFSFFQAYNLQDVIVLPISENIRIAIYWRQGWPEIDNDILNGLAFLGATIRSNYENWYTMSALRDISSIKDLAADQQDVGIAILDEKMNLLDSSALFQRYLQEIFHATDPKSTISKLLYSWEYGDDNLVGFSIKMERYEQPNLYGNTRIYYCILLKRVANTVLLEPVKYMKDNNLCNFESLSRRELEVLNCFCQGMNCSQISSHLFISEWTVKTHVKHIYTKLGINNQRKLINEYMKFRLSRGET